MRSTKRIKKKTRRTAKPRQMPRPGTPRFPDHLDLSSDVYWEQDENLRYTRFSGKGLAEGRLDTASMIGKTRWELPETVVDPKAQAALQAKLEAREPFRDFNYKRVEPDGRVRYIATSGAPVFDDKGRFRGYRGIAKDVTERVQTALRLTIEHGVTGILAESDSIGAASPRIIRLVCETLGWACGARWEPDEGGEAIGCAETWGVASAGIDAFLEATRRLAPSTQAGGLNRRAWAERKPLWIRDVTKEATFRRAPAAVKAELRSAFAFPIKMGAQVIGVMEFFSREIHQPDAELLDCTTYIGSQIGQFMQRERAEEAQRRFRAAIDVSADLVLLVDPASMQYVDANETACRVLGYSRDELLGMGPHNIFSVSREDLAQLYDRLIAGDVSETVAEGWYRCKDGSRLFVESFRHAVPSAKGHTIVAVARDITERKRAQQLLKLEHTVTRSLAGADSAPAAIKAAIRAVCEVEGWECGRYLSVDERAGLLRFGEAWSVPSAEIERYIEESRGMVYGPGVGVVGRVWQSGQPLWVADIGQDARVARTTLARETGMHGAFAVAVLSEGKTIGVLIFHSREIRKPEERLLQTIGVIGNQLGQYVQRKQAEEVLRESEERFRTVVDSANEGILAYDRALRVIAGNAAAERIVGLPLADIVGAAGFTSLLPCVREDGAPLLPEDRPTRITIQTGSPLTGRIIGIKRPDGSVTWLSVNTGVLRRPGESDYYGVVSTFSDVTFQRQAEAALRQSEERFRSLTNLSSDWFWEQDAAFRFTRLEGTHISGDNSAFRDEIGKTREEIGVQIEGGAQAHDTLLETHRPFRDVVMWRIAKEGQRYYMSISGEPIFDQNGAFLGYRGVGSNITERKRSERLLALEHAVNRCLSDADDVRAVLKAAIRAVCETEGWECGRYFRLDEKAGLLRFAEAWSVSGELMDRFIEKSRGLSYAPGVGLIGQVWQSGQPIWSEDIAKDGRIRAGIAREIGMHGSFVFPVLSEGKPIGVLIFHSREIRKREERLLQTIGAIGNQIGQYVQRKQAEEVVRENEARFRGLTELSSDWYWEQDENLRFTQFSGRNFSESGLALLTGKTRWEIPGMVVDPAVKAAVQAKLDAREPFYDFEYKHVGADGGFHYVLTSGMPVFDASGRFSGYRGIAKDITVRRRAEQLLALEHAVNRCLADAKSSEAAVTTSMRAICETEGWECGRYFRADEKAGLLRFAYAWHIADPAIDRYIEASRELTYAPGAGMTGKVWQSGEPLWASDRGTHNGVASRTLGGNRDVFIFPLIADGKTVGVCNFLSRKLRTPDARLLQTVRVIGSQIGQFLQRKQAEEVMRESEERFRSMTQLSNDVYWEQDEHYRFTAFTGFGGNETERGNYVGKHRWEQNYINMTEADWKAHVAVLDARQPFRNLELCRLGASGEKVWESVSGEPMFDSGGRFTGYRGVGQNITQRKQAESATVRLANMFAALSATNDAILHARSREELYQRVCDAAVHGGKFSNTAILMLEPNSTRMTTFALAGRLAERMGISAVSIDESVPEGRGLVGIAFRTRRPCVSNDFLNDERTIPWQDRARKAGSRSAAAFPLIQNGHSVGAILIHIDEVNAFDDEIVKLLERMAENVSFALDNFEREAERRNAQERIEYLATHDGLTDLPNRVMFSQLLNLALQSARRYERRFAVLFLDLDRFKIINDTLGHEAGDLLLQEMARRIKETLRSSDVVARLGGDEFVVLLQEVTEPEQVVIVARKLLSNIIKPVVILGQECRVTASIGISMYPNDAQDEQALMKNADMAMYLAKEEGKNNFQFFSKDIKAQSVERLTLETGLRRALEREEFFLHYQAKVDLGSGAITGVEALVRWQHPDLGLVSPAQFIPLAEETGLIVPIGKWVLRTACAQNMAWQRAGLPPVCMAVNLSPRQFADENLLNDLDAVLSETGMRPELLELEITESMVMGNVDRAARQLNAIKERGVRLAIDDFGTGYSSLAQIKRFPIDTIKVDRSFIREIPNDAEDKAIAEAIIAMGRSLSLTVVAEGVETEEQQTFLRAHACHEMQGYYFSKPVAADQFADLLRTHVPAKTTPN